MPTSELDAVLAMETHALSDVSPAQVPADDTLAPKVPRYLRDLDVGAEVLADLALKIGSRTPQFTTESLVEQLGLPSPIVAELLEQLRVEHLIEILGESRTFCYRFALTGRGRERAARLFDVSGYVGRAPVSLDAYVHGLQSQFARWPQLLPQDVAAALRDLVLPEPAIEVIGLAASSGRSLFLYGPTGNGKTTAARHIHQALQGQLWIPYCVAADGNMIRVFDPQCHRPVDGSPATAGAFDQRWVAIHRPFVMVGGELTLESLELAYHPVLRYYEAPLHWKANGGTFLVDDLGCQRVSVQKLLNRWILPLEHRVDYLTLHTGQQIRVPFQQHLIFSTNLDPSATVEAALLRRMGYRLYLGNPTPQQYADIFNAYAASCNLLVPPGLIERLLQRYEAQQRPLRSCEPRDLVERVRDICRYRGEPLALSDGVIEAAWNGYFGSQEVT
jgi:energy-coupling factor transporter ATP-binding protein EcfA2